MSDFIIDFRVARPLTVSVSAYRNYTIWFRRPRQPIRICFIIIGLVKARGCGLSEGSTITSLFGLSRRMRSERSEKNFYLFSRTFFERISRFIQLLYPYIWLFPYRNAFNRNYFRFKPFRNENFSYELQTTVLDSASFSASKFKHTRLYSVFVYHNINP